MKFLQRLRDRQHDEWKESVADVLGGVKRDMELILKSDLERKQKIALLIEYAVSPREVWYPNVMTRHGNRASTAPIVKYGNQLIVDINSQGEKSYSLKQGVLWGRGLLYSELQE